MKSLKKVLAVLLVLVFALAMLTACGGGDSGNADNGGSESAIEGSGESVEGSGEAVENSGEAAGDVSALAGSTYEMTSGEIDGEALPPDTYAGKRVTFNADGTFLYSMGDDRETGKYAVDGSSVYLDYDNPEGEDHFMTIEGDTLISAGTQTYEEEGESITLSWHYVFTKVS